MANTKVTQHVIANNAITADQISSAAVTDAKLHSTLDLSGKTLTLPATAIPSASTATTQTASDNSTKLATTAYVTTAIANLNDSAPTALNTLNELAAALGDDANFSATITTALGTKLPLAGGTLTGNLAHASDLTLDLGGDLIVDVDGDNVWFDAAGTRFLSISQVSSDVYIGTEQNDKDLFFRGKDGSSTITALTLDMSEAGFATFNDGGAFGGTGALRIPQGTTGQRPSSATGQIRWNTTDGALEVYNGSAWTAVGAGSSNKVLDTFTGNGSNATFTLSVTPANEDAIMVFIDGAYQEKADYTLTNNSLVLDTAPLNNEKIAVHTTTAAVHDGTSAVNQQFTATAGQTAFTLSQDPSSENNTQVYINGVYQQKTDYTVSGTTLTFDTGLTVGDVVEVNMFTVATLGNTDTVTEGVSNLYHTTARANSAIDARVTQSMVNALGINATHLNSAVASVYARTDSAETFTGNVGIGGVNPLSPLSVQADSGAGVARFIGRAADNIASIGFYNNAQNADAYLQSNSSWIRARADGGFHFRKGNTPIVTDTDGFTINGMNLGIGTADPQRELHVHNSSSGATPTSNSVAVFEGNDNTEISILGGSSSVLAINFGHSGDNNEGLIYFNTTTGSENMQLQSTKDITYQVTSTNSTAGHHIFKSYNTEIMRLDGGSNNAKFTYPILQGGSTSSVGIGSAMGDVNGAELGPGYLNLARDDTAAARQIQFSKNGSQHSYIDTSSAALEIGAAAGLRTRILGNGNTVFSAGNDRLFSIGSGTYEQGKIRQYVYQNASVSNGTVIDLFGNTSAHTDIHYLITLEAFHSGRSYRTSFGSIGGYGWYGVHNGTGINFNNAAVATGRQKLTWTNSSGWTASVYISALIFGNNSVDVYNGALSELV